MSSVYQYRPSPPEMEQIELRLQGQASITQFTEYSFNSNFLEPTDGWSFTIGAEQLDPKIRPLLAPGAAVELWLNGRVQSTGFIDSMEIGASRDGGTEYRIEGRDKLGQVVDACADPTQSLAEGMTLLEAMKRLFGPFGWDKDESFEEDAAASRTLKSGVRVKRHKSQKSDAKGFGRKAIKATKLHQYRPYAREGVFEFASRIVQRHGLWIWSTPDGEALVLSTPDFEQDPSYRIIRNARGETNVLEGTVKFDVNEQPTHIVADSYAQGGEFGRGQFKVIMANNVLSVGGNKKVPFPPQLQRIVDAGARFIEGPVFPFSSLMVTPGYKVLYLHDDESQTIEQLETYARREMALLQRQSLTANYTVEGHGQLTAEQEFAAWTVDTTVEVQDEIAGLDETLYVFGRTFNKSRSGGTTTQLELIRLNTLQFTSTGK